jgi:asparagine N-glycosylation enzyme membrane subunit Stt3
MKKVVVTRPSPALVVAFVALLVALGGTAFAAFTLPKNSVGTQQLKNNAVTTKKIKNGAVTKAKINTSGLMVPNAGHANSADSATNAAHANSADSAINAAHASNSDNAVNASNAANATQLGGVAASSYQQRTLPSGQTETGIFSWWGYATASTYIADKIEFNPPLAADLDSSHYQYHSGGTTSANCPGVGQAAPGWLCLYEGRNDGNDTFQNANADPESNSSAIRSYGTIAYWQMTGTASTLIRGTWAVTAP